MNIESRILSLAKSDDSLLAAIAKNWQKSNGSDPVSDLRLVQQSFASMILGWLLSLVLAVEAYCFLTNYDMELVGALSASGAFLLFWHDLLFRKYRGKQMRPHLERLKGFLPTLKVLDSHLGPIESSNERWKRIFFYPNPPEGIRDLETLLSNESREVVRLQSIPWRREEAIVAKERFLELLQGIRDMIPNPDALSDEFEYYPDIKPVALPALPVGGFAGD